VEAISPGEGRTDSADDRLPAYPVGSARSQEDAAELAAAGGALVTALVAQRWNEANRTWLQRRIGAAPSRQAREEVRVRVGALLGGTLAYLLVTGGTEGLRRLQDRGGQREVARSVCRILGVAATAPDGSMPEEASFIVESALISMGLGAKTRKRLLAEPRPVSVSDLGACPLPEPLLSAVAVIAFTAMAEAASPRTRSGRCPPCCAGWDWPGRRRKRRPGRSWTNTRARTWSFPISQPSCGPMHQNVPSGPAFRSPR
jgi:hypothetical protein